MSARRWLAFACGAFLSTPGLLIAVATLIAWACS